MKPDPPIDEIRRIRRMISAEYGNDPRRMLEYFADIQARVKARLVDYGAMGKGAAAERPAKPVTGRA